MKPALSRLQSVYERHEAELIEALTLDGLQHEIERGGPDRETTIRLRRRFLDLTNPTDHQQAQEAVAA